VIFGGDNDQCRIPAVQASASQTLLYVNLISGFLSALVSPRLGELSDRHGRMRLLSICVFGTLLSEVFTTYLAAYPDSASVNWFFVAAFIDGLCGSFTLGLSLVHSYAADCTSPERRNVVFGLIHATLFAGIALGPFLFGLIAKYSGLFAVFLAVLALHGVYFVMLVFFIPESLSKERQVIARTKHIAKQKHSDSTFRQYIWREIHPANIFKPLAILYPKPSASDLSSPEQRTLFKKLRKNLVLIAAIDTLMFGVAMGTIQIIILYAEYIFGWKTYDSSVFLSIANSGRVFTLLVILPTITRLIRGPQQGTQANSGSDWLDILCIRLAILFDLLGYIGFSLSKSGGVFTLSAVVASFGGMGSPTLQSSLTKHVPPSQTGRLLGATGLLHSLARVVSPIIFNLIYSATVGTFPQTVFVCLASVFALAGILSWFISPKGQYI
jgi:MFS family permease